MRAKATRNLLLEFHHPEVSLCLIIAKGHFWLLQEAQHISFKLFQPQEQIMADSSASQLCNEQ
jgi:tRNA G10  N-methylase Trm11